MRDDHWFGDDLGPSKILLVQRPEIGLRGIVVVDNVAAGPAIGGVRFAADVTVEEVARLARAMTLKNAMAALPHGGAKSAIVADPNAPAQTRERLVRAFARAIEHLHEYIPGPDMGTSERDMAFIFDEIGRASGLPATLGGIPLDEIGATGFGLAIAAEAVEAGRGLAIRGARVAIQGFGSVGRHAARFLEQRGAVIVAVSDRRGGIVHPQGLSLPALEEIKRAGRSVTELAGGTVLGPAEIVAVDCDILIPAARPDVLTEHNAGAVRARLVLQGANIPATPQAEAILDARGIVDVPDFVANAGGVICAATEWARGSRAHAMAAIEDKIRTNVLQVLDRGQRTKVPLRQAAVEIARARVADATTYRRRF